MLTSISRAGILIGLLVLANCVPTSRDPTLGRVQRNVLTPEQILETRASNAFDAIQTLRSNWLIPRGVDSFGTPGQVLVYFNDTRLGGVSTLESIGINDMGYVQYFDGREASARWGLDHGHGVIYITTLAPR